MTISSQLRRRARELAMPFRHTFRRSLEDPTLPLSLDMGTDSSSLLVAFGGMRGQLGMPPFEFFKVTGGIPVKRLFVRDLHQAWYHRGIPGYGDTLADSAASLRRLIDEHGVERLVLAGNSAGGYAALAFASLLGADTALAFVPQTVLLPEELAAMDDHRWDAEVNELIAQAGIDPRFSDLRTALAGAPPGPRYEVYFDEALTVDRLHAERIERVAGVTLHRLAGGEHSVALQMRQSGELERVLRATLLDDG
jgi:pimeloyl-ACP methyl ester carboxylesterase